MFTTTPTPWALYNGETGLNTAGAVVATTAYLVPVVLEAPATITSVRVRFVTGGNGHYDVGIYDATGVNGAPNNLLAHAAATATSLATAGNTTASPAFINGNLSLPPGRYWLAFWIDNGTDTFTQKVSVATLGMVQTGTTAGPLPALASSLSGLAETGVKPNIIGLVQGGWA